VKKTLEEFKAAYDQFKEKMVSLIQKG